MTLDEMPAAIEGIETEPEYELPKFSFTNSTGTVAATANGRTAYYRLPTVSGKTVTPSTSTQTAVNAYNFTTGAITVGPIPSNYVSPSGTKSVTENGTYDVKSYASVSVNVPTEGGGTGGGSTGGGRVDTLDSSGNITGSSVSGYAKIPNNAYKQQTYLTSVSINDTTTSIGNSAFYQCTKLENVTLPETLTTIVTSAFYGCTKLATINFPSNLTTINPQAFSNCRALTEVHFTSDVKVISSGAFSGCTGIKTVIFPYLGKNSYDFLSGLYTRPAITGAFTGCTGITDIYVPWSSGVVSGAPWGATNATVHYDYRGK